MRIAVWDTKNHIDFALEIEGIGKGPNCVNACNALLEFHFKRTAAVIWCLQFGSVWSKAPVNNGRVLHRLPRLGKLTP